MIQKLFLVDCLVGIWGKTLETIENQHSSSLDMRIMT